MMKTFYTLLLTIGFGTLMAQPTSDTFPDFTYTDLDGNEHHLQSYLNQGKTVVIDVFATWCSNCQNSVPGWESLYQSHGQAGDQSLVLLSFERDPNTTNEEQYISTYGVESPVITEATDAISNLWNVSYQPRYFVICPDGSFVDAVGGPIGNNPQPLIDETENCPSIVDNIAELQSDDISVYVSSNMDLTYSSKRAGLEYAIIDLTGSMVQTGKLADNNGEIDIADLHNGIYLISFSDEQSIVTLRFMKQ